MTPVRQSRNRKNINHEAHEEHEGRKYFLQIRCSLLYPNFVTFVVRKSFLVLRGNHVRDARNSSMAWLNSSGFSAIGK